MKHARPAQRARRLQILDGARSDPYRRDSKPAGPERCPGCGALWRRGRWSWSPAVAAPRGHPCPACLRIRQRLPAGYVSIEGRFLDAHRGEVLALLNRCEAAEKARHPLQRVMRIESRGGGMRITTTDSHLARRMGIALRSAYKGSLQLRASGGENLLRVTWRR